MPNELDEFDQSAVLTEGHDVHVINKQITVTVDWRSTVFQIMLWVLGILPGIIFWIMKIRAKAYLQRLQQKLQHDASTIDNYQQNRVIILQNTAKLLDKSIDLDKSVFADIARLRSGTITDAERNELQASMDTVQRQINVAVEAYPDLKAHHELQEAMRQNNYLQQEITAAREVYNDTVMQWNADIFSWPTKMIVAAKAKYSTRIPFVASQEMKAKSEGVFF